MNQFFIPSKSKYQNHIERKFAGDVGELAIAEWALKNKTNIFAMGDAGTGKTEFAYWFASLTGRNLAVVQCNGMTTVDDLLGTYVMNPDTGKPVYQPSALAQAIEFGNSVVLLDEIFKLKAPNQSALHSLLDDRRCLYLTNMYGQTRVDAHDDVLIIASGNPDYKGDSPLNEAFFDRFGIKLKYGYDKQIESSLFQSEALRELVNNMRAMSTLPSYAGSGVAFETPLTPRMFKAFESLVKGFNWDFALESLVNNFPIEEQEAVRNLFKIKRINILNELGIKVDATVEDGKDETAWI